MSTPQTINELPAIIIRIPLVIEIPITFRQVEPVTPPADLDQVDLRLDPELSPQINTDAHRSSSVSISAPSVAKTSPSGILTVTVDGSAPMPLNEAAEKIGQGVTIKMLYAAVHRGSTEYKGHHVERVWDHSAPPVDHRNAKGRLVIVEGAVHPMSVNAAAMLLDVKPSTVRIACSPSGCGKAAGKSVRWDGAGVKQETPRTDLRKICVSIDGEGRYTAKEAALKIGSDSSSISFSLKHSCICKGHTLKRIESADDDKEGE